MCKYVCCMFVHVCITHAHKRVYMCVRLNERMFFCVSVCFHVCTCECRQLCVCSCGIPSVCVMPSDWLCACACAHVRTSVSDQERVREVLCAYATLRM